MNESTLQERVILKLKSKGWNLLAREYYVFPKMQHLGKGDLLFRKDKYLFVVETKYIDLLSTGRTARSRRTQKRKHVRSQARKYAEFLAPYAARRKLSLYYGWVTNEDSSYCRYK